MLRIASVIIFVSLMLSSCMRDIFVSPSESSSTLSGVQYATGISDTERVKFALDRKKELRTIRK